MKTDTFMALTKRISPKLKGITHYLDGKYTYFKEDDLYQEAMVDLWRKNECGILDDKTDSYVLQGCYFYLKNHIRKVWKKTDAHSAYFDDLYPATDTDDERNSEDIGYVPESEQTEHDIEYRFLCDAVRAHLTEREQRVLELLLEEKTVREIGEELGVSHVMVIKIRKSIAHRCKGILTEASSS